MTTARALTLVGGFGIDRLRWTERSLPAPGPREAVVRMSAVSLNYRDLQIIEGRRPQRLPLVPLSDGAGVVVAVGEEVTALAVGDRVMPAFAQGWITGPQPAADVLQTLGGPLDGVAATLGVWRESGLVKVPECLADIEAATLPCAAVSAWNALFEAAALRPGETVLVQGTGGVSVFALQFAKMAGARAIVISSSDEKLARARRLGADDTINYLAVPDWGRVAREISGAGVDLVVEVAGEKTFAQSLAALRNGGAISYVGFLSGTAPTFDLGEISRKSIRVHGIRVGNRDSFERMCSAVSLHRMTPVVDSEFAIHDITVALERLRSGRHFGKICLRLPPEH
jgi:NADPH:quinone reductase-like Zn-dependent oxidoreductase